jgi:hypothetical protein
MKKTLLLSILFIAGLSSFATITHVSTFEMVSYSASGPGGEEATIHIPGSTIHIKYNMVYGVYIQDSVWDNTIYTNSPASTSSDQLKLYTAGEAIDGSNYLNAYGGSSFGDGSIPAGSEGSGLHYVGFQTASGMNGWIELFIEEGSLIEILGYAYETEVGVSIDAGDKGGVTASFKTVEANEVSVFPNPTNDVININVIEEVSSARIIGMNGTEVLTIANPTNTIDVSTLQEGSYILLMEQVDGQILRSTFNKN